MKIRLLIKPFNMIIWETEHLYPYSIMAYLAFSLQGMRESIGKWQMNADNNE